MQLSERQKRFLRGLGHDLKPVVTVGDAGLSESLRKEFDSTISHHELIKVRVRAADRQSRDSMIHDLCQSSGASLVTRIGNVALVYRCNEDKPVIPLPRK